MFTAVAIPTLDEEDGIDDALYALSRQTRQPDVVILADGGSTDATIDVAREAADEYGLSLTVGQREGTNIGASCEAAVLMAVDEMEVAGHEDAMIVRTDADSLLSDRWIERAHDALAGAEDPVVFGGLTVPKHMYSHADVGDPPIWDRAAWLGYSALSNANPTPKGRGMAFSWSDFQQLGGYCLCDDGGCNCSPEWYEDAILTTKAKLAGRWETDLRAHIFTEMPTTTLSSPDRWSLTDSVRAKVRKKRWRPGGDSRYS